MKDRYLYRAKQKKWRELPKEKWWAEGYYAYMKPYHCIMPKDNFDSWVVIDEKTLCQCTGLKDKNGKLIWENDICIIRDGILDEEDGYFRLDWEIDRAMFEFEGPGLCVNFDNVYGYECEVVGNIFDNPELLEVE